MNLLHRTDVMSTNLHMLSAIRLALEEDRIGASCRFALDASLADHLSGLGQEQLWALVMHVGQSTLFPPRQDLLGILRLPIPLTGALAAANPPYAHHQTAVGT